MPSAQPGKNPCYNQRVQRPGQGNGKKAKNITNIREVAKKGHHNFPSS